jgi:GST-like protein
MESGAILIYLADKTGKFLSHEPRKRYDTLQWLAFQIAHVGPMFGQAGHFNTLSESIQYAKDRYNNESVRLYHVLDRRLGESPWLGCDEYSIADIATYPWTKGHKDRGVDAAGFPHFMRWYAAMEARPAVQRNNQLANEIRERMTKAAEGKQAIDIYNTRDNADRLKSATGRT